MLRSIPPESAAHIRRARRARTVRVALITAGLLLGVAAAGVLVPADWGREAVRHAQAPAVFLHRGGSARWPQNTLVALRGAVGIGAPGVEFDVGLTADGVPVMAHDPWVDAVRCTHADGRPITAPVLIGGLTFAELRRGFRCGGLPDPDFPAVVPVPQPIASLDEALAVLAESPRTAVYLDVKIDPADPRSAEAFAAAVFEHLRRSPPPNALYVEGPSPEAVAAFRSAARGLPFTALISAPAYPSGRNWTLMGLAERVATRVRPRAPVERTAAAGADGLVTHTAVLNWSTGLAAHEAGQQVVLFGHGGRADIERFCRWPIDALIIPDPAFGDCRGPELAQVGSAARADLGRDTTGE